LSTRLKFCQRPHCTAPALYPDQRPHCTPTAPRSAPVLHPDQRPYCTPISAHTTPALHPDQRLHCTPISARTTPRLVPALRPVRIMQSCVRPRHSKAVHCGPAAMRGTRPVVVKDITPGGGEGYHARWWGENSKNLGRNPSYLHPGLNIVAINFV
jgi:hypothetical protein